VSFDTTVRKMTEMFWWPKCLSKNWTKFLSEKKQKWGNTRNNPSDWYQCEHSSDGCQM